MTSTTKSTKDKPHPGTPRLVPRPTAASAARAARNATNRNLSLTSTPQRLSPTRCFNAPVASKSKTNSRISQRIDSKTDLKLQVSETNTFVTEKEKDEDQYLIPNNTTVSDVEQITQIEEPTTGHLENINEERVLVMKNEDKNIIELPNHDEVQICRVPSKPLSRPITPTPISRPQTPKSLPPSRPQTPRALSRPTTPALAPQRHGTPASRPNTPTVNIPTVKRASTRPTTPASVTRNISPPPQVETSPQDDSDEDVKSIYIMKQKEFNKMKKELDFKQQAILEVFDSLRGLHDRMSRDGDTGCGEGQVNDLVLFNVADWTTEEIARLCRDAVGSSVVEGAVDVINAAVPIDECVLSEVDTRVMNIPTRFADLCLQAFTARQELIDWMKELIKTHPLKENDGGDCLERIGRYNAHGLAMCDALRDLKHKADEAVETVVQLSRRACRERGTLIAVGESLVREVARLRQDIEARTTIVNGVKEIRAENESTKALEESRKELEEEKTAAAATKDKLATTEVQLRQSRIRINKMDRQLREAEASIASLTGTVKTLEDQSRQREVQLEARARKLKESLKTGEVTSGQLAQQRDALMAEVAQLKEHIENMTTQHKTAIQEFATQLKESKHALDEERKLVQREREVKEAADAALVESQHFIEEMKLKINELENSRPNPDLPTEREMDLWAELQATKDTLRLTEDEVTSCKREKVRFLESLTKLAESENKIGMQQKLAAELLSKEETVGKMQIQVRELTKNIKLNEQKVTQYEQYVRDLQAHNRAVANCQESPNGISYQDLQQEIMNLKMSQLEAVHRNEELAEMLVQKDQQLEQQDKTSRAQARVIKVREELINMLKNKETEQSRELTALQQDLEHRMRIVDEVNKQIAAKAEEIQELFTTLENKQQQIHRLEKIVLALEEQQRRAQAQRTRHEEKIAALEHELAAGGNRRER